MSSTHEPLVCISIQLENANYDANAALSTLNGPDATEWLFLRFHDVEGLRRAIKSTVCTLKRKSTPGAPTLLMFHTHIVADRRSRNLGDFLLEMKPEGRQPSDREEAHDSICSVCRSGGRLLLCAHCPTAIHRGCCSLLTADGAVDEESWACPTCCSNSRARTQRQRRQNRSPQRRTTYEGASAYAPEDMLGQLMEPLVAFFQQPEQLRKQQGLVTWIFNNCAIGEYDATRRAFAALSARLGRRHTLLSFGQGKVFPDEAVLYLAACTRAHNVGKPVTSVACSHYCSGCSILSWNDGREASGGNALGPSSGTGCAVAAKPPGSLTAGGSRDAATPVSSHRTTASGTQCGRWKGLLLQTALGEHPTPLYSQYEVKDEPAYPKFRKLWITSCGPVCAAMAANGVLPTTQHVPSQLVVARALDAGLYDPADRVKEVYMSPESLAEFTRMLVERTGAYVTSAEVGRGAARGGEQAAAVLAQLLRAGCTVTATVRTCFGQLCDVFYDHQERTSHFVCVTGVWRCTGSGRLAVSINDPACTLADDRAQLVALGGGKGGRKRPRLSHGPSACSDQCSCGCGQPRGALSSMRGEWAAEAGSYILSWEEFDLSWDSSPDGKDRWYMAVHPPHPATVK
jgi:hypothetical protein